VRYYGGINLGTGGLSRAYSKAGIAALSSSKIIKYIKLFKYNLTFKYSMLNIISNVICNNNGVILDKNFDIEITIIAQLTRITADIIITKYPNIKINLTD